MYSPAHCTRTDTVLVVHCTLYVSLYRVYEDHIDFYIHKSNTNHDTRQLIYIKQNKFN